MFIHRALNSISARPAMILAPVLIVLVLTGYYWNMKRQCEAEVSARDDFLHALQVAGTGSGQLKLADINPNDWDFAKMYTGFEPRHTRQGCPLGWGWSEQERQDIIAAGNLGVILFFNDGAMSRIIEFNSENIALEESENPLTREAAYSVKLVKGSDKKDYHISLPGTGKAEN